MILCKDHIDLLGTQLDLVSRFRLELYAQHYISKMGDGDD